MMALIDYGQVPPCVPPADIRGYKIHYRESPVYFQKEKWIDAKFLNTHKGRVIPGDSKALVGVRIGSGKWGIIRIAEAV